MLKINDYILIGDIENKHLSITNGYKYLRRLELSCPLPSGYKPIIYIHNKSVYDNNGVLYPKFWALKRILNKDILLFKKWFCSKCKTISNLKLNIQEEDFKCIKCGKRYLLPVKREELYVY